jgi:PTS system galactitol-specific IIB component
MKDVKNVLVVCGLGVATSTVAVHYVEEVAKERNVKVQVQQCKAAEVFVYIADIDLIVTTTVMENKYSIPMINALPLITGIGKEEIIKQIGDALVK